MSEKTTKSELITQLADRMDISRRQAKLMVNNFLDLMTENLIDGPANRVSLHGFGTFEICEHESRKGVDPRDHEKDIQIPKRSVPKFRAGKTLKREVREAFDENS